jgi:hypothetical protein
MTRREDQFLAQLLRLSEELNAIAMQYDDLICDDLKRAVDALQEQLRSSGGLCGGDESALGSAGPPRQSEERS